MDTILVVNAGSSSVKFQVFAVDGDGRLRRQIKGQMDGIGSRPRLRATGVSVDTLADRAYPIESVPDVPVLVVPVDVVPVLVVPVDVVPVLVVPVEPAG